MRIIMNIYAILLASLWILFPGCKNHSGDVYSPISVLKDNPAYFLFRGKPTVLITQTNHFGAVVNSRFDFEAYLGNLYQNNLNATRIFSGSFLEPYTHEGNNFEIAEGMHLVPWSRSHEPGYRFGGNKFDLSNFSPEYFERLRAFIEYAGERGIVVYYTFFAPFFYEGKWSASPFHPDNNINNITTQREDVFVLEKCGYLKEYQLAFLNKEVEELEPYDNVVFELLYDASHELVDPAWNKYMLG